MGKKVNNGNNGYHFDRCLQIGCSNQETDHAVTKIVKTYERAYRNGSGGVSLSVNRSRQGNYINIEFKWRGPFPESELLHELEPYGPAIKPLY